MIVAATTEGAFDLETGDIVLEAADVAHVAAAGDEWWALADRGRRVLRRLESGRWEEQAMVEADTATAVQPLGRGNALVGTAGAHLIRVEDGQQRNLDSFEGVPGRSSWYNPASSGRPDVWSCAADGDAVFVSVHVGGLWRSGDFGETWVNALEPEVDIHQVAAGGGLVVAAAEGGFATSRDSGRTWTWTTDGLHAPYLQSVALTEDSVFVGASSGPFAKDAAVYRASPPGARFERRSAGLPESFPAIGPYHLAADGDRVAVVPWSSTAAYLSLDAGATWAETAEFPRIRSLAAV